MSEKSYLPKGKSAKKNAKILRKNMTAEERHLWYDFLRDYQYQFHRQYVILDYIVDFFCPSARLVIELDGSQHCENKNMLADLKRTSDLNTYGVEVVRYNNREIKENFTEVCKDIDFKIKQRIKILNN